jgi:hypothetical protein
MDKKAGDVNGDGKITDTTSPVRPSGNGGY